MTSLLLDRVHKAFGAVKAVDGVSLRVDEGELVSILGPSGCGKTTLLRVVTGFLKPDEGRVLIGNEDVTTTPPHRRDIGIVYQSYALWPHMTVQENVSFGLEMRGFRRKERSARVGEALELVGLADLASRHPSELSGGQQQRVALARSLAIQPKLLLLDEPLSSLDANLRVQLRYHIREVQRVLGVTTLFVTHDQDEALSVSDRIVLMKDGQIVQVGSGETVYRSPSSRFVMTFMGEVNLVRGEVVGCSGYEIVIRAPFGLISCNVERGFCNVGDVLDVGFRPDEVELAPVAPSSTGSQEAGRICSASFLGPWVQYEVMFDEGSVMVKRPSGEGGRLQLGDWVKLRMAETSFYLVGSDTSVIRSAKRETPVREHSE